MSEAAMDCLDTFVTPIRSVGRVVSIRQGQIEVDGICPNVGDRCLVYPSSEAGAKVEAEVIAVSGKFAKAILTSDYRTLRRNDKVTCGGRYSDPAINVDRSLAIDAVGRRITSRGCALDVGDISSQPALLSVAERDSVSRKMMTGDNAIDHCLPLGFGQRVGLFAEAGAGKSMLLRKLLASVECDHIVFAMIGERSREAIEAIQFVKQAGLEDRVTFIVGLAGDPATLRSRTMATSLAVAQHFAHQGGDVLHLVDSLSRFAYAVREVGMAAGEPMAQSGMTPSVYQQLPEALEMAGNWKHGGSITTIAAVLMESHIDDPMSSYVRSLLDGHIYLDKSMVDRSIFPAIDILRSRSRLDSLLLSDEEQLFAKSVRTDLVNYQKIDEYLHFSGYEHGTNPSMDKKISRFEKITSWIQGELTVGELSE